jgi:soluble lytic murein transglycosylase
VLYIFRDDISEKRKQAVQIRYPMKYSDSVIQYSALYNIDKFLIFATIKTESGFDAAAVSETGARGLMQIMPDTFDWIKFRFRVDVGDKSEADTEYYAMYTPETNIKYGAYYLSYLAEKFADTSDGLSDDEVDLIACGYYAGAGGVSAWLENKAYSKDGKTLDKIPYRDAENYAKKIRSAYKKYLELYQIG